MTNTRLSYRRIEDYLGPGATRFFGAGYRRAAYQIGDIVARVTGDEPGVRALVTVHYPRDWSRKADDADLRPHLSSIDTLVLGAQLSEVYLVHAHGLDADARRSMWLRKVNIKAGVVPQEELVELAASVRLRGRRPAPASPSRVVSVLDCKIGAMRVRLEIEHRLAADVAGTRAYESIDDVLGPAASRYYGDGFKFRQQIIEDVHVDMDELSALASAVIGPIEGGDGGTEGIEGDYQPSVSMVDCFVVNLQLAQVLMYELDAVRRSKSNTLWMLQTALTAGRPMRHCSAPLPARTTIASKHLLPLRGGTWRNVDIVGELGGIGMRSSLAHELPADAVLGPA